jgi:hypothetical protein
VIYLDTSALAKIYVKEKGSDIVGKVFLNSSLISTSKITYPEMLSALLRRTSLGDISKRHLKSLINKFEEDWQSILVVEFHDELLSLCKKIIKRHLLKAADAIHLSSALWLRSNINDDIIFVASDDVLNRAASAERLKVLNPQKV